MSLLSARFADARLTAKSIAFVTAAESALAVVMAKDAGVIEWVAGKRALVTARQIRLALLLTTTHNLLPVARVFNLRQLLVALAVNRQLFGDPVKLNRRAL